MGITLKGVKELQESMLGVSDNLKKELGTILWKTGRHIERKIAALVTSELKVTQSQVRKENLVAKRSADNRRVTVTFSKTARPDLKDFKPRQNATGTAAVVLKSKKSQTIKSAFMGAKPGRVSRKLYGHVWRRLGPKVVASQGSHKGKMRQPLIKLKGVSPTAVYHKNKMHGPTMAEIDTQLEKELRERIRWNNLKRSKGL